MPGTPSPETISTRRQRIAELARQSPQAAFTTLAHHIDIDWMVEAFRRTRKDGAVGVDGQTAKDYAVDLEGNLRSLLDRAKSGRYQAPPVRRVHIPKGTGSETRPIGIPTFEDKILQRAVAMVLESVYEQDFLDCSYGFRPGRSAHQALDALWHRLMEVRGGWVLEIDIRKFFDALDHRHLRAILRRRVRDGVLLRLIGKWLKAGVLEEGRVTHPEAGSPQGGVISPILANAYLHEVLDTWFEQTVKPRLKGQASLIRYADDAVLVFERAGDARRVLDVLPKRFGKYGLTLHPEKTRLVPFQGLRPGAPPGSRDERPGTFDFLGFTHYWGRTLKGNWAVKRRTAKSRFNRSLKSVAEWCREYRHRPIKEQWVALTGKLRGHYAYYGIPGNMPSLNSFRHHVTRTWHKWLCRRSDEGRIPWERFGELEQRFPLPPAKLGRVRPVT
ncbi:MAG: group II intron reverse transcriptase/maturase [Planctomycetaceae bacterium]|nr:group II intron reverse transcriptase/maturase [Planctomycetaceae bacterium]